MVVPKAAGDGACRSGIVRAEAGCCVPKCGLRRVDGAPGVAVA
jgi:hypothetical protein